MSGVTSRAFLQTTLALMVFVSACSGLRRDWREDAQLASGPTVGGRWSERGMLDDDGLGRSPAGDGALRVGGNWVNEQSEESYRRDLYRGRDVAANADESGQLPSYQKSPNLIPQSRNLYKNGMRATRADFRDEDSNEGSLWASGGQTNYYFTKNKIRAIGDILTIQLDDSMVKDVGSEIKRTLSKEEYEAELMLAQERLKAQALGPTTEGAAGNRAPAGENTTEQKEVEVREATAADVNVLPQVELKKDDTIMAEIIERYPNGNYKIRGTKRVNYKTGTPRLVQVIAIAKSSDINEDDTISSGKLYEYRLEAVR